MGRRRPTGADGGAIRHVLRPSGAALVAPAPVADATPPWWCAHRSRSSALGLAAAAGLVCLAAGVAAVGFLSAGSGIAASVALVVLTVAAANVVSGGCGAAWWAKHAVPVSVPRDRDARAAGSPSSPAAGSPGAGLARPPVVPARGVQMGNEPTTRMPVPALRSGARGGGAGVAAAGQASRALISGRPGPTGAPRPSVAPGGTGAVAVSRPIGPTDPTENLALPGDAAPRRRGLAPAGAPRTGGVGAGGIKKTVVRSTKTSRRVAGARRDA